jgi:L-arabinokinase
MPPSVFFYISGHGFGHAIRQIAVINALHALVPDVPIVVRTTAPDWLFTRTACGASALIGGETDTGLVQIDSLRPDVPESIRRARGFLDRFDEHVRCEAALLRANGAELVISDAPPLACAAAAAAGIRSVVCANFTWDWIYAEYAEQPGVEAVAAEVGAAYSTAHAGWRLPLHGGFQTIRPILDLPFISRHARAPENGVPLRRQLGLPPDRPLALVSFGGYGIQQLPLDRLDCLTEWDVVLTSRGVPAVAVPDRVHVVPEEHLYGAGLRYEDLVGAVDVVVTKPGYGIIADCVANDTAMLYTSRGRFAEYEVMVAEMPRYVRCRYLELAAFEAGRWSEALRALRETTSGPPRARTDGAQVAAGLIADLISVP